MTHRQFIRTSTLIALVAMLASGCERSTDGLRPFPLPTDPEVFTDTFGPGVNFQAFLGSKLDALSIDATERHTGAASLKFTVPAPGDPSGGYAGGAFVTNIQRDLSGYDALTFWARASRPITLDVAGLGNDNTGTSRFTAQRNLIPLTTTWTKFVIPIPLPARLSSEGGLFFVAEGPEGGLGAEVWFDDVRFEKTGVVSNPRPSIPSRTLNSFVGAEINVQGTRTIFDVSGTNLIVEHMAGYLDFVSSNGLVAAAVGGVIRVLGSGSASITGSLGTVPATGSVTINAIGPPASPAPTPMVPASDVISLFSDAYPNVPVNTWSATWDQADVADLQISGNATKGYTNLIFAGIEFTSPVIDATAMTHFHIDVYLPSGTTFRVKLVDFGANGVFGGGDDKEHEKLFNAGTTPPVNPGAWVSLDVPLAEFTNLTTRAHLAQITLAGSSTAFIDNVYLHK
jgi:hypothetical protein